MKTVFIVTKEKFKWKKSHKASKRYHEIVFATLAAGREYVIGQIGGNDNYVIDESEHFFSAVNKKNGKLWTVIGWSVHK
jgi:hypothetical protein